MRTEVVGLSELKDKTYRKVDRVSEALGTIGKSTFTQALLCSKSETLFHLSRRKELRNVPQRNSGTKKIYTCALYEGFNAY
jgi:hypothetical protein